MYVIFPIYIVVSGGLMITRTNHFQASKEYTVCIPFLGYACWLCPNGLGTMSLEQLPLGAWSIAIGAKIASSDIEIGPSNI